MDSIILYEILNALRFLLVAGIVWLAWKTANDSAKDGNYRNTLWKGFLWCIAIALFASYTLGNPSCEVNSYSPYGGCIQYADNGYEVTFEERIATFIHYIILLYIPVIKGALDNK